MKKLLFFSFITFLAISAIFISCDIMPTDQFETENKTLSVSESNLSRLSAPPVKPRHWVVSDYSPKTDPDDRVVMSVLLLWANEFRLEGLALGCSKENEQVGNLFKNSHGPAYAKDYPNLSKCYSGYPTPAYINSIWMQGSTTPQGYKPGANINNLPSVKKMVDAVRNGTEADPLYVTIWGPMGEAAQAADHMLKNEPELLKKVVFISHSTAPSSKNNCKEDAQACKFLHDSAAQGKLYLIEVGDSGQSGIDKCRNGRKINEAVRKSALGNLMSVKWKSGYPDWSDGASWMVLLGHKWGILDYTSLKADGSNNTGYLTPIYCNNRASVLYPNIEERAAVAVGGQCQGDDDDDNNNDDDDVVSLFPDADWKGKEVKFNIGSYNQAAMVAAGMKNDDAHSIKLLPGYEATLYTGGNFDGQSKLFIADAPRLGGQFSNQVSSLIVRASDDDDDDDDNDDDNNDDNDNDNDNNDNDNNDDNDDDTCPDNAVRLWADPDYKGTKALFTCGSYNQAAMVAAGMKNNDAHSIKIIPGYKATIFTGSNFDGQSKVFTADTPRLGGQFSNLVSSLIVEPVGDDDDDDDDNNNNNDDDNNNDDNDDDVVSLFPDADWKGNVALFNVGDYNQAAMIAAGMKNNDAHSIRVMPGYEATLYTGSNFDGQSKVFTADASRLGGQFSNLVSSVKVRQRR